MIRIRKMGLFSFFAFMRKVADRATRENIEWVFCSHNYMEKGTEHLSQLAAFLEGIQRGEITDCKPEDDSLCYTMDDEISIYLPAR